MKETEESDDSIEVISSPIKQVVSILSSESEPDTEDEIERIQKGNKKKSNNSYDQSTDEDTKSPKKQTADDSSDFFNKKVFYLHESLSSVDVIKLKRLINIYKGDTIDVAVKADYILSNKSLPQASNTKGVVLRPLWVFECHEMECLIPIERYKV